jgi:mono/diheme cytochrome c family protein
MNVVRWILFAVFLPGLPAPSGAVEPEARSPRFADAVEAIFRARCVHCHGAQRIAAGGLRLDSYDAVMRGGERGPAVVPGNPRASVLLQKVLGRDRPAMPPRQPLPRSEKREIRAWIENGATP